MRKKQEGFIEESKFVFSVGRSVFLFNDGDECNEYWKVLFVRR
jgi:hypothetical protein